MQILDVKLAIAVGVVVVVWLVAIFASRPPGTRRVAPPAAGPAPSEPEPVAEVAEAASAGESPFDESENKDDDPKGQTEGGTGNE